MMVGRGGIYGDKYGDGSAVAAPRAPTNHLSVMIDAIGHDQTMKVKTALYNAGYVIYKESEMPKQNLCPHGYPNTIRCTRCGE